ncbi:MAG: class II aldolase/adducin family protein [Sphingobacteriales bacterium]|nr:MAG: class II aldolase/adducin family protein [Sphingobacteriales bacterium]
MKDRETPFQEVHMREGEWQARCDLAAAYRLVAMFGWDDLIGTHLSARIPGTHDEFLINPLGQMFDEITASSLVKVNMDGEILQNTPFTINKAGFVIHSAVHAARNDVDCVIHLHTRDGVAVSATDTGLLPLNQSAMVILPHIARHAYEGVAINEEERERLVADLGGKPMMLLDNHGTLCVGSTVGEAFNYIYMLEWACSTQVRTLSMGLPIRRADPQVVHNTGELLMVENLEQFKAIVSDLVWPALLRKLDRTNPGYRE